MAVFPGSFSESVPFLKQPANLDGSLPGDAGFDPLGFSEVFDLRVLREAELKHGRIAMLAALGYIVQEVYTFPFFDKVPFARWAEFSLHDVPVPTKRRALIRDLCRSGCPDRRP